MEREAHAEHAGLRAPVGHEPGRGDGIGDVEVDAVEVDHQARRLVDDEGGGINLPPKPELGAQIEFSQKALVNSTPCGPEAIRSMFGVVSRKYP